MATKLQKSYKLTEAFNPPVFVKNYDCKNCAIRKLASKHVTDMFKKTLQRKVGKVKILELKGCADSPS